MLEAWLMEVKQTMAKKEKYPFRIKKNRKYYYWGYLTPDGKSREESAPTIEKLEEKVKKRIVLLAQQVDSPNVVLEDYLLEYLVTSHFNKLKPKSIERYLTTYNNHIKDSELGKLKINKITVDKIQRFYNDYYDVVQSSSIIKSIHKLISPCLRYAYGRGDVVRDFSSLLSIPSDAPEVIQQRELKKSAKPLTVAEQMAFVEEIRGEYYEVLYRMALDGGYRIGELAALQWHDVDFSRQRVYINKSYSYVKDKETQKYKGVIGLPKNKIPRRNRIPNTLIDLLKEHKEEQKKYLRIVGIAQSEESLVFGTPLGTYLDKSNVNKSVKKVYKKLGINWDGNPLNKCFHDLRHTYATRQFEMGVEPLTVSKLLGHSNLQTTLKTYIHVLDDLKDATADATDDFYATH